MALQPAGAKPSTRVAAHLIDSGTFLFAVLLVLGAFVLLSLGIESIGRMPYETGMALAMLGMVPVSVIQLMLVHQNGQSIGKRVMNLRVVMLNGERVGVWRVLFLRNLAPLLLGSIPFIGFVFRIANVAALFSDGNRAIHDRFAGTKVIRVTQSRETAS